jgi:predicted RNA binding protein YcfA (HicA-like mRNA interferase family)
MAALPAIHYRKVVKAFEAMGWQRVRQKGSHIIMVKEGNEASLSIPAHTTVAKGTLRALLRSAGITVEEFKKKV